MTPSELADLTPVFDTTGYNSVKLEDLPMYKISADKPICLPMPSNSGARKSRRPN